MEQSASKTPTLPKKWVSRKDEITDAFFQLMETHVDDLLHLRVDRAMHAKQFGERLFIHPRHLTNTIKLTTGRSPCDILEERLSGEAARMLRDTDLSVADIGSRVGYSEPTNFIKFFKGMQGTTPLRYRKAHRAAVPA